jgi:hypothetical protein
MTKSNTTSTLGHARMGDHRLIVPHAMQAFPLWLLGRIWPDANDRRILLQFQRVIRTSPPQPERKPASWLPPAVALGLALDHLVRRHHQSQQYEARWSFAAAVQRQATAYKIVQPFDFYAAYAGLVSRPLDSSPELTDRYGTGPHPVPLMIVLGVAGVDGRILTGGSPDDIAKEVCRELIDAFSCGEYTQEDQDLMEHFDTSLPDAMAERASEEDFIATQGG